MGLSGESAEAPHPRFGYDSKGDVQGAGLAPSVAYAATVDEVRWAADGRGIQVPAFRAAAACCSRKYGRGKDKKKV